MKKLIILAVEFMLFIPMLHAQDTLRIMTYNISAGEMADMQQLGSYINSIHPDIVALQEVDYQTNRSYRPKDRGKNQPGDWHITQICYLFLENPFLWPMVDTTASVVFLNIQSQEWTLCAYLKRSNKNRE